MPERRLDDDIMEAAEIGGETFASVWVGERRAVAFEDAVNHILDKHGGRWVRVDLFYSAMALSRVKHTAARHYMAMLLSSEGPLERYYEGETEMIRRKAR